MNTIHIKVYDDNISPFGKNQERDLEYLLTAIKKNHLEIDELQIIKAFTLSCELHEGQKRRSGVPYYVHPLSVALILIEELKIADTSMITAALLHDVIEDIPSVDKAFIENKFDKNIADLIDGITKIAHTGVRSELKKNKAETYKKLFMSIIQDGRIFLIKLCDRLHNLRTLQYLPNKKRTEIAEETLNFYTPFAHKLGITKLKMELETRSFFFYNYNQYKYILEFLAEKKRYFAEYMFVFVDMIKTCLNEKNIPHHLSVFHKHEYEIFLMLNDGKKLEEIDNISSLIIVLDSNNEEDCYMAHKALAAKFSSSYLVDYIVNPKTDWYRSINTELYSSEGKVEIIIRTAEMQEAAENGFISNITKKKSASYKSIDISEYDLRLWGDWMQDIIEQKGEDATQIIWNSLKNNVFDESITVYTKDKTPVHLPPKSTLIDFAFSQSEETGLHTITGKVNSSIKNIFSELNDGDVVEVITSAKCNPDSSWLNHIVSWKANCCLYNYFKTDYRLKSNNVRATNRQYSASLFRISGIDKAGILPEITQNIGKDKIHRIALSPSCGYFEATLQTEKLPSEAINSYFLKLSKIQGIKSIEIK